MKSFIWFAVGLACGEWGIPLAFHAAYLTIIAVLSWRLIG